MRGRAAPCSSEVISMNDFPTLAFLASGAEFLARIGAGPKELRQGWVRSSTTAPTKISHDGARLRRRRREAGRFSRVGEGIGGGGTVA